MSRPERVVLRAGAVWLGILVTHAAFCLLLGANVQLRSSGSASGVWFAVLALVVGAIPAVVIGWSLAMPLGLLLRPVSSQWIHVAAFGVLGVALGFPFGVSPLRRIMPLRPPWAPRLRWAGSRSGSLPGNTTAGRRHLWPRSGSNVGHPHNAACLGAVAGWVNDFCRC